MSARRLALTLVAVALAATACGTTVPLTSQGTVQQQGAGLGLGGPAATDSAAAPGDTIGSAGDSTSGDGTSAPGTVTGPGTTTGAGPGAGRDVPSTPAGATAQGRGVTASTITVGIAIPTGTEALEDAFGVQGAGSVSVESMAMAVRDDINKRGGILGRKLVLYVHSFDAAAAIANPEAAAAAICTDFRDDHKVFAVVFDVPLPSVRKCLADMGSPLLVLGGVSAIMPEKAYSTGFVYGPTAITVERLSQLFVSSLADRAFFSTWNTTLGGPGTEKVKLGVIHVDTPDTNALYAAYAKDLGKRGLRFDDTVTYSQDAAAALSATQNAVLKFRADGVTHVFGASAFFLRAAENQNYRPRYAYLPGLGALGVANVPPAQMKGAQTVGWVPSLDVNDSEDPGPTAGQAACLSVMKAARLDTTGRGDRSDMLAMCDVLGTLRASLAAGGRPNLAGLATGYASLGRSLPSAYTFGINVGADRRAGISSVRDLAFDDACACLKYTSSRDRS